MMRNKTKTLMLALAAVAICAAGLTASAGDAKVEKRKYEDRQEFTGTIVCLGCELEKRGADAQCTLHAKHAQGLLAEDGTLWTFIDNARGHYLIREPKLLGKPVRIEGWKFPKTQYIEAWSLYRKKGEKWQHWDYCKVCGWEPGDHKGAELCADCAEEAKEGK
jgi:hypothetical protein